MVKKSHLKWSIVLPILLLALAVIGIVIYILLPAMIGILAGGSGDVCYGSGGYGDGSALSGSLSSLCMSSKTFLGVSVMLLIVVAGASSLVSVILVIIDAVGSAGMDSSRKALWILAVLFFGFLAAAAYYLVEVRPRKD